MGIALLHSKTATIITGKTGSQLTLTSTDLICMPVLLPKGSVCKHCFYLLPVIIHNTYIHKFPLHPSTFWFSLRMHDAEPCVVSSEEIRDTKYQPYFVFTHYDKV